QLRLWFASMAYVLLCALRRIGLSHTRFANASCGTIRLKLLKIGALVRTSVRRIKLAMASSCHRASITRERLDEVGVSDAECRDEGSCSGPHLEALGHDAVVR